jgi:ureidoglycolate lyase
MPVVIAPPQGPILIDTEDLRQEAFSSFGTVIENPRPSLVPTPHLKELPPNAVQANQGSALKYLDVTSMRDLYHSAPSGASAKTVMNMFVCAPRKLIQSQGAGNIEGLLPIEILERHPYTTQTFIPLGISPSDAHEARYLVIVAPSLPPSAADSSLPVPEGSGLPGRGLPDLTKLKAFVAKGSQAVTYGAGIWHAPMVVVGSKPIDFVVVQFANEVGIEDCQEVKWDGQKGGISVAVPGVTRDRLAWKL